MFFFLVLISAQLELFTALPPSEVLKQNKENVEKRAAMTYNLYYQLYTMKRSQEVGLDFKIPKEIIAAGQLDDVTFYNKDKSYEIRARYKSDTAKKLDDHMLESNADDFSLTQHFRSYMKVLQNDQVGNAKDRYVIVATNIALDDSTQEEHFVRANVASELDHLMKKGYTMMLKSQRPTN